jgi:hypothetical protein
MVNVLLKWYSYSLICYGYDFLSRIYLFACYVVSTFSKQLFRELIRSISDVVSVQNKVVSPVLFDTNSKKKGLLQSHRYGIVAALGKSIIAYRED